MKDLTDRLKALGTEEERYFVSRLFDKIRLVLKHYQVVVTDFIDPHLQDLAQEILDDYPDINWDCFGGNITAERKRVVLGPDYQELSLGDARVTLIEGRGDWATERINTAGTITHRDYLGAFIGTGIRREKIGDIWVTASGCVIAVAEEIESYLVQQPVRVKGVPLFLQRMEIEAFHPPVEEGKLIVTTVSSLRLDAVAAAGFSCSRSRIVRDISAGKIRVNWQEMQRLDYQLHPGDVLSARGRGRVVLEEIAGLTKKGRVKITLKRFC